MNEFERRVGDVIGGHLRSDSVRALQVNLGLLCNQECAHCHLAASPRRTEVMSWPTMQRILEICEEVRFDLVDLTGGAPELNPHFREFVSALRCKDQTVQVRTNLTVFHEPGMEPLPQFFRDQRIQLVASLPCYLEKNVCAQRGPEVYGKSIESIRRLNTLGYGNEPDLTLDLVYNPGGPFLPPEQSAVEGDYRRELGQRFGITFSRLLAIANMPLGRFQAALRKGNREQEYMRLLKDSFNPDTVESLMCRHQVNISWDGMLYDCDFNLALRFPVNHGAPDHLHGFDLSRLRRRRIVTGEHCFGCTAGAGSSCRGSLV